MCDHRHRYGWSGLFQIFDQMPHLGFEPRTSRTLSANSTTGPLASADGDIYLSIILQSCNYIEVSVKAQTGILHVYSLLWLNGLVVWFSLWVREAPGSNPGWAQLYLLVLLNGLHLRPNTCRKIVMWPPRSFSINFGSCLWYFTRKCTWKSRFYRDLNSDRWIQSPEC